MPITTLPNAFARSWGTCGIQVNFAGFDSRSGGYERHRRGKDWWTLNVLIKGRLRVLTAKNDLMVIGPAAYVIPPKTPFREIADKENIEHFTAGFYVLLGQNRVNPLLDLALPQVVAISDPTIWTPYCQEAAACFHKHCIMSLGHSLYARLSLDRLLHSYLASLPKEIFEEQDFSQQIPRWISDVREKILKNVHGAHLNYSTIVVWSGFTAAHVSHAFKRAYGISPMRFVQNERMKLAVRWLGNASTDNIADLAQKCGYKDPSLFTRHFTAKYGVPPRLYRGSRSTPSPDVNS